VDAVSAATAGPAEFSTQPVPRVELGTHSQEIMQIVPAGPNQLLTVSFDKTARLWSTRSQGLKAVWRAPDPGGQAVHDGFLYCAAVSPDRSRAVLGGYLRPHLGSSSVFSLFLVDMTHPDSPPVALDGFRAAIQHLLFSPDGTELFVGQGGGFGFVVLDWAALLRHQARIVASDQFPDGDEVKGAAFASNGDLAVAMGRGSVRFYTRTKAYLDPGVIPVPGVPRPMLPRLSPDGQHLALASEDAPVVGIVDMRAGKLAQILSAPAADDVRALYSVEWSADGRQLYTGGEVKHDLSGVLYRVDLAQGYFERLTRWARRLRDLARLPDGAIAYATGDSEMGVLEPTGELRWRIPSRVVNVRLGTSHLSASQDGLRVQFRPERRGPASDRGRWLRIDFTAGPGEVVKAVAAQDPSLKESPRIAANRQVLVSADRKQASVGNVPLRLNPGERVLDWAFVPGTKSLLLGTSQRIYLLKPDGSADWQQETAGEVDTLVVSGDRRWVIAALQDGTVRWYRYSDGAEVAAVLPARSSNEGQAGVAEANSLGDDWVAWTPSGHYVSSPSGDQLLGWQLNRLRADGVIDVRFYRAVQFERLLYRPSLVREYVRAAGHRPVDAGIGALAEIAPPRLSLSVVSVTGHTAHVRVDMERSTQVSCGWNLFVNAIPVLSQHERDAASVTAGSGGPGDPGCRGGSPDPARLIDVPLSARTNNIRLELSTPSALGVAETFVDGDAHAVRPKGKLYVAAVGVSHFDDKGIEGLKYPGKDADSIADALTPPSQEAPFAAVRSLVLSDDRGARPTGANIRSRLATFFAETRGEDTVVLFMASHGVSDTQGNYYFTPVDARAADTEDLEKERERPSLVSWSDIVDLLGHAAGQRVLIVDSCASGALETGRFDGRFDVHSLAKRSMSSNFALMAASSANETSQEYLPGHQGLFTYALLQALDSVPPDPAGAVTLEGVFEEARRIVATLHDPHKGPQTPVLIPPRELAQMPLAGASATGAQGKALP
jgi:WD40 repeat protein